MTRARPPATLLTALTALLMSALACVAYAQPGHAQHGHAHGDHGHGTDAAAAEVEALRAPLVGNWLIDHSATVELMARQSPDIAKADRDEVTRELARAIGEVRMTFTRDGGVLMGDAHDIKRGLYVVQAGAEGALTLFIYDTADNRLATSEYAARLVDGHLHLTHAGDTMALRRPTATEAGPARAKAPTAPTDPRLAGRWTVDLDRTLAAHVQLDTLTPEERAEALTTMTRFFGKMAYTFDAEGGMTMSNGDAPLPARYRVVDRRGDHLDLELTDPNGTYPISIDLDGRYMRFAMKRGKEQVLLVLVRE